MEIDLTLEMRRVYANNVRSKAAGLPATLTIDEWIAILERFQGRCSYCETAPFSLLEHIVPHFADGGTTAENCVPSCKRCNNRKCDYLVDVSLSYWERIEQIRMALRRGESIPRIWQPPVIEKPSERTTFPLYEQDKQAIRAIREYYGVRSDAEAIRIALRETWRLIKQEQAPPKPQIRNGGSSPT